MFGLADILPFIYSFALFIIICIVNFYIIKQIYLLYFCFNELKQVNSSINQELSNDTLAVNLYILNQIFVQLSFFDIAENLQNKFLQYSNNKNINQMFSTQNIKSARFIKTLPTSNSYLFMRIYESTLLVNYTPILKQQRNSEIKDYLKRAYNLFPTPRLARLSQKDSI